MSTLENNTLNLAEEERTGLEVAVIGMAGRFPFSRNIDEFWQNLLDARECITFYSDEQLKEAGISSQTIENPTTVKAASAIQDSDRFDAQFFNYAPSEVESMDPQIRHLHEVAWETLEDGGYMPDSDRCSIGLYAGASPSYQWEIATMLNTKSSDSAGWFGKSTLNNKDLLTTRVSYNLDLSGPSITLYTACSTSLIAVDQAYRALLTGLCDMALAGGSTVYFPGRKVNPYQEGMIFSPDGHTRAFDASCKGSVFGEAVALVLLKPLEDAIRDRDHIYAVILGSATNNDGAQKVAYSAVGVKGQSDVIKRAIHMAGVDVHDIGYIEAHGTGTPMGDTVEIEALTKAFATDKRNYCAVGSVKSNMGHLDVAAGVSGFIKACLVLKHKQIPASLHIEQPNPQIDWENSPFFINTKLRDFQRKENKPLIAGVESFGVGGSNAHMVLREWDSSPVGSMSEPESSTGRNRQLVVISAKTETALDNATANLARFFADHRENPGFSLIDAAYTLQAGRRGFPHRRILVCDSIQEAEERLSSLEKGKVRSHLCRKDRRPVIFMFAGLGAQYVNMGRGLYDQEPLFRREMDRCFDILRDLIDVDMKEVIYPDFGDIVPDSAQERIDQPEMSQVAIFIFEYSLARLLMGWGITPHAMIGYSFGEYIAACAAGVFSLEHGLKLVVERGRLIQSLPEGAMLSIPVSKEELTPILATHTGVSFAIDNGPSCIVVGPLEAVEAVEQQMKQERMMCMRVPANRAIHSPLMEPVFDSFGQLIRDIPKHAPQIPYIGNVTGNWVSEEETQDPQYWLKQLGSTVQFARGMKELLKEPGAIFVEIGPGRDISTLAQRHIEAVEGGYHHSLNLVRHPNQDMDDSYLLLNKVGQLWLWGASIDWDKFHGDATPHRISMPTYPWEGGRYWIDEKMLQKINVDGGGNNEAPSGDIADWFYVQNWKRTAFNIDVHAGQEESEAKPFHCLVFIRKNHSTLEQTMLARLEECGHPSIIVEPGTAFKMMAPDHFLINPASEEDYYSLFNELGNRDTLPTRIIQLWGLTGGPGTPGLEEPQTVIDRFYPFQDYGFFSLLRIAKAIGKENFKADFHITVITDHMHSVTGEEPLDPEKITVISPVMVIPQEYPNIRCRSIDIQTPTDPFRQNQLMERLVTEIRVADNDRETIVAYRGHHRWVQVFERTPLSAPEADSPNPKWRENGVYLMIGGVGKLGMQIAKYMAERMSCKFIITGRSPLPPKEEWDQWLEEHSPGDRTSLKINRIREVEALGSEVLMIAADAADMEQMQRVIQTGEDTFGPVNAVMHLAGIVKGETFAMIRSIQMNHLLEQFRSKVDGLLVLERLIRDKELDFCWIMSSLASVLGGLGFVAYSAANLYLDAYTKLHNRHHPMQWFTMDWEDEVEYETRNAFERVLRVEDVEQWVFCRGGRLHQMLDQWIKLETMSREEEEEESNISRQPRPDLLNPYVAPEKEPELTLSRIWQNLLGFESVGVTDDFLELGGDSLKAITMITRVHKEFNVNVPLTEFFSQATIEHLASYLEVAEEEVYQAIQAAEEREYYPLSAAQKRIYIMQQMDPGSVSYNESNFGPLSDDMSAEKLEQLSLKLMERHESLRTSFPMIDDQPVQRVHALEELSFSLEKHYLDAGEDRSIHQVFHTFIRPFDLSAHPPVRVGILETHDNQRFIMLDMHHIITDDYSIIVFMQDLQAIGQGKELKPLGVQYRDYAVWQNSPAQREALKKQQQYWTQRLGDQPPRSVLPGEPGGSPGTGYLNAVISQDIAQRLMDIAGEIDATPYMTYLALCNIFISRLTGLEDIVIGTLTAGRGHGDLMGIIGMFVNTLVLRNMPEGELSFKEFLSQVRTNTLEAFDNQDYQFDQLVETIVRNHTPGQNPLFDVIYSYYAEHRDITGETPEPGRITRGKANSLPKFDFSFYITEKDEHFYLSLIYNSSLFSEEIIERYYKYIDDICTVVAENPDIKLKDILISHQLAAAVPAVMEEEQGDFGF